MIKSLEYVFDITDSMSFYWNCILAWIARFTLCYDQLPIRLNHWVDSLITYSKRELIELGRRGIECSEKHLGSFQALQTSFKEDETL